YEEHRSVHDEYCVGHTLGVGSEISDEHRYGAAAYAENYLACLVDGRCGIVCGHKYGAEHKAARQQMRQHILEIVCLIEGEEICQHSHCAYKCQRCVK